MLLNVLYLSLFTHSFVLSVAVIGCAISIQVSLLYFLFDDKSYCPWIKTSVNHR